MSNVLQRNASSDSLSECESSRNSSLVDASPPHVDGGRLHASGTPLVPNIVKACFAHIETYGIFFNDKAFLILKVVSILMHNIQTFVTS